MVKATNLVTGIYGFKGDYKTTTMVYFLNIENMLYPNKDLFANMRLNLKNFKWLDGKDMIDLRKKLDNSTIGIDELHEYADSRNSSSFQNKRVADFFLQSRHTKSNIYYTTQFKDQVDKRIRRITDVDVVGQDLFIDSDGDGDDDLFRYTLVNRRRPDLAPFTDRLYAPPVWRLFDSSERINPFVFTKKEEKIWHDELKNLK